ncbi:MAG: hypothetical protein KKG88_10985 [Proteobacteria bacterium]|nr:hypothetical protein [Pseudomonadota bacterium]
MIKYASIVITTLTAALYTLGLTFYQSYLLELGIEETLFPMTIDRTIFHGFIASTSMSAKVIMWFLLAAEGVVLIAALIGFIIKIAKKKHIFKDAQTNTNASGQSYQAAANQDESFLNFSYKMLVIAVITVFSYLGIILVLIASGQSGKEAALRFKENAKNKAISAVNISLKNGNKILKVYPIVYNQNQCSFYDGAKTFVLSLNEIYKLETEK